MPSKVFTNDDVLYFPGSNVCKLAVAGLIADTYKADCFLPPYLQAGCPRLQPAASACHVAWLCQVKFLLMRQTGSEVPALMQSNMHDVTELVAKHWTRTATAYLSPVRSILEREDASTCMVPTEVNINFGGGTDSIASYTLV